MLLGGWMNRTDEHGWLSACCVQRHVHWMPAQGSALLAAGHSLHVD